jgi:hypothetical protein
MQEPDDQMLMAYADGQLDPAMAAEIGAVLARDPVAREKVRSFRETADLARAAFEPVLSEPVPEALLASVRAAARKGNVVPLRRPSRPAPLWSLPLAASVALAIGLSGGWWLGGTWTPSTDILSQTLERAGSGDAMQAGEVIVTAASVFPASGDRWCRDFTRQHGDAVAAGFACRVGEGQWQVEALLPTEDAGAYAPASDEEPSTLEGLIEAVRSGPALGADQEADLIARGWR